VRPLWQELAFFVFKRKPNEAPDKKRRRRKEKLSAGI
jgi:hypothetical protein